MREVLLVLPWPFLGGNGVLGPGGGGGGRSGKAEAGGKGAVEAGAKEREKGREKAAVPSLRLAGVLSASEQRNGVPGVKASPLPSKGPSPDVLRRGKGAAKTEARSKGGRTGRSNSAEGSSASSVLTPREGSGGEGRRGGGGRGRRMPRSSTFAGPLSLNAKLTPTQKRALKTTWHHMAQNGGAQIMERIFQKLINARPKVKDVFYKAAFVQMFSRYGSRGGRDSITTIHDHGKILAKLVEDIVSDLPNSAAVMRSVMEMGRKHAFLKKSGLRAEVWESFGEAALEILAGQDCVKSNVDAVRAWTLLVACLIDELRFGFEQENRDQEKRRLSARRLRLTTQPSSSAASPAQGHSRSSHSPADSSPRAHFSQSLNVSQDQRCRRLRPQHLSPDPQPSSARPAKEGRRARSEEVPPPSPKAHHRPGPSPNRPVPPPGPRSPNTLVPEEPVFRSCPAASARPPEPRESQATRAAKGEPQRSLDSDTRPHKPRPTNPPPAGAHSASAHANSTTRQSSVTIQSRESSLTCATAQLRLASQPS